MFPIRMVISVSFVPASMRANTHSAYHSDMIMVAAIHTKASVLRPAMGYSWDI